MTQPSGRRERIAARLRERLAPDHVELRDDSHLHRGHAGAAGGGGHFSALVVASVFEGKSLVERQRLVYGALAGLMGAEIHALALETLTPQQWRERNP